MYETNELTTDNTKELAETESNKHTDNSENTDEETQTVKDGDKEFHELQRKQMLRDADFFDVHVDPPFAAQRREREKNKKPGKSNAIYAFIFGLIAILFWFSGSNAWFSMIFAAIGFLCTFFSKRAGYPGETFLLIGFFVEVLGATGGAVFYLIDLFGG